MRLCSTPVRHCCDIDSLEALADVIGLTVGEIKTALYGMPTMRRACCQRMLSACVDSAVLERCSAPICRMLSRHLSAV